MIDKLEIERQLAAKRVIESLQSQPGVDVLPAAVNRLLGAVRVHTGYQFKMVGKGRSRYVYEIIHPEFDLGIVIKVGNQQSNEREKQFTEKYPEDWAKIYASFAYGTVSERVDILGIDDPRIAMQEFQKRWKELIVRYDAIGEVGLVEERIVLVGSSVRYR